jgi:ABC-2 type transport system permease protein
VRIESGPVGAVAFLLLGCAWSLAFAGFGYAIALKTGNPAGGELQLPAVLPVPVHDLQLRPRAQLTGWLGDVAGWNPVTYVLEGLRSLVTQGWQPAALGKALLAVAVVAVVSMSLCLAALRGRTRRG